MFTEKTRELKFKDICDTLNKHFSPQPIKIAERYHFYDRKQAEGESAADYQAQLRQLASSCQFEVFLDEALCDRLVWGVREPGVQRRLLAEADLTFKKEFQLIQGMKAAAKNAEEMQRENSIQQAAAATNVVRSADTRTKKLPCSRCLSTDHNQTTCKYRTAKPQSGSFSQSLLQAATSYTRTDWIYSLRTTNWTAT